MLLFYKLDIILYGIIPLFKVRYATKEMDV